MGRYWRRDKSRLYGLPRSQALLGNAYLQALLDDSTTSSGAWEKEIKTIVETRFIASGFIASVIFAFPSAVGRYRRRDKSRLYGLPRYQALLGNAYLQALLDDSTTPSGAWEQEIKTIVETRFIASRFIA